MKYKNELNGKKINVVDLGKADSNSYINSFEIGEKQSRKETLNRLKQLANIANKNEEIVNHELIRELAKKKNFKITENEIRDILNS